MASTTTERGYGGQHVALRKRWAKIVAAGEASCARCGRWIAPGTHWDLGHADRDRSVYVGPEHRRCNRATAGRRRRLRDRAERIPTPFAREW
jgi:hypothetical protein